LLDRVPCELEHYHGGKCNHWAKVQAFFYAQHHVSALILPYGFGWLFGLVEC
jgi:hypothetical protein